MIKDVVIHNGLLRIATGTFVCMVRDSEKARVDFLAIDPVKSTSTCRITHYDAFAMVNALT
jgi:hypothetical protein